MHRLRVYLDTSVIGGCFDEEFEEASNKLIECIQVGIYSGSISQVTLDELDGAPEHVRAILNNVDLTVLPIIPEIDALTDRYLEASIVTRKYREDAAHIAAATVHRIDVLVSWNFRHIVNLDKIHKFNLINRTHGYPDLEIRSPKELIYGKEKEEL